MYKVRKLNFALNVGKGKTNGKTLSKVVQRLYIPPAQQKSGITKERQSNKNYEQYGTQKRYSHTTTMSFFVVRRHGVTGRPQDTP